MTKEDLRQIAELLDEKLDEKLEPINKRLDAMDGRFDAVESRLDAIEENTEVTRGAVNALIEWADNVSVITEIKFPVEKKKA